MFSFAAAEYPSIFGDADDVTQSLLKEYDEPFHQSQSQFQQQQQQQQQHSSHFNTIDMLPPLPASASLGYVGSFDSLDMGVHPFDFDVNSDISCSVNQLPASPILMDEDEPRMLTSSDYDDLCNTVTHEHHQEYEQQQQQQQQQAPVIAEEKQPRSPVDHGMDLPFFSTDCAADQIFSARSPTESMPDYPLDHLYQEELEIEKQPKLKIGTPTFSPIAPPSAASTPPIYPLYSDVSPCRISSSRKSMFKTPPTTAAAAAAAAAPQKPREVSAKLFRPSILRSFSSSKTFKIVRYHPDYKKSKATCSSSSSSPSSPSASLFFVKKEQKDEDSELVDLPKLEDFNPPPTKQYYRSTKSSIKFELLSEETRIKIEADAEGPPSLIAPKSFGNTHRNYSSSYSTVILPIIVAKKAAGVKTEQPYLVKVDPAIKQEKNQGSFSRTQEFLLERREKYRRYREKVMSRDKNRQTNYVARKRYADSRPRVNGRFMKLKKE